MERVDAKTMIVSERNVPPSVGRPLLTGSPGARPRIAVDADDEVVLWLAGSHLGHGKALPSRTRWISPTDSLT